MTNQTISPRDVAYHHIVEALNAGVRGDLRDVLKEAERLAAPTPTSRAMTQLHYDRLQPGQKLLDPDRSGLLMRHGKRSGKVWVFRYSHPTTGKQVEYQFGSYPDMSLSEARDRWSDLRTLRSHGKDPASIMQPKATRSLTVTDLVETYLNDYARKVKRSHATDERLLRVHLVPTYGQTQAIDFGHREAADLLHRVHKTAPREAEKLRACISTMFNFASGRTRKVLVTKPILPPTHDNPVSSVLLPQRQAKNHKPTAKELASYSKALAEQSVPHADVLHLQLLTMTRIAEAAQASWSEFDLDNGRWTIPAERAKNGREHTVLLSPQAQAILTRIHSTTQSSYVFPMTTDNARPMDVQGAQKSLAKNRATLGVSDAFTSHAVRHAGLTWAAEQGCPRDVRDRLTNHVSGGGVDAIYNAASLNTPAKEWWAKWAGYLDTLTQPNVVPLKVKA